jgi:hypothetical protein
MGIVRWRPCGTPTSCGQSKTITCGSNLFEYAGNPHAGQDVEAGHWVVRVLQMLGC